MTKVRGIDGWLLAGWEPIRVPPLQMDVPNQGNRHGLGGQGYVSTKTLELVFEGPGVEDGLIHCS